MADEDDTGTEERPQDAAAPAAPETAAEPEVQAEVESAPVAAPAPPADAPREKPAVPGAEPLDQVVAVEPIEAVAIDLAAGARYRATGKRKTAIARVTLRPGTGSYTINGRTLDAYFPRETLQRNIRQPLETVGYEERMDVVARMQGGGVSAQAGALRHGISRALLEADPNLRGELKRRGFLTRDARAKERKKAGLKKARKRPQFSKR
jgi:small subunit ribosomal protein S9